LCGNENLESVITLSDFKTGQFGRDYGVEIQSGAFAALNARAVVVADQQHKVRYTELVPEIGQAPNIEAALKALG
jgi:thiol peroxidase